MIPDQQNSYRLLKTECDGISLCQFEIQENFFCNIVLCNLIPFLKITVSIIYLGSLSINQYFTGSVIYRITRSDNSQNSKFRFSLRKILLTEISC